MLTASHGLDRELIRDAMTREVWTTMKIGLIYFLIVFNEIEFDDFICVGKIVRT